MDEVIQVRRRARLPTLALAAILYYVAARGGLQLQFEASQATPVWPPSGVALASFMLLGLPAAIPVFLGALVANLVDFYVKADAGSLLSASDLSRYFFVHTTEILASAAIGIGNTLEAALAWFIIRRFVPGNAFDSRVRDVLVFAVAVPVGCLVSSTVGVASLVAGSFLPTHLMSAVWFTWWLGDMAGMLIITPFAVGWAVRRPWPAFSQVAKASGMLVLLAALTEAIFDNWLGLDHLQALAYTPIPLLLWIEFTFGNATGSLGVVIVAAVAVAGTIGGHGPFRAADQNDALLDLQGFVAVVAVTASLFNAALRERGRALIALRSAHDTLESRVAERTAQLGLANEDLLAATADARIAHEELERSKESYKSLYVRTPALMHSIDGEGRLLSVSDHWLASLGYQAHEVIGRKSHDFLSEDSRRYARDFVLPRFFETGVCADVPYQFVRKNGELIDVLLSATSERDAGGSLVRSLAVMVDVTERNRAEAALRATELRLLHEKERAEEASEAKSMFLAHMSHEIRTPMNGVIGLADLLLDSALSEGQRQQVLLLKKSGTSLLAILNDILDLSKIETGKLELELAPTCVKDVATSAMEMVQAQATAKRLETRLDLADDLPSWILADEVRLRQILLNLLSNAVKFTEDGSVRLAVTRRARDGSDHLSFAVTDTGIGIAADRRHLLFQSFSQVDHAMHRRYGGSGLGLAISRRLAEAMGGEVDLDGSTPGAGSTFAVSLPVAETEPPPIAPTGGPVARRGPPSRILVVEDIPLNQMIVEAALVGAGHRVVLVGNGVEAIHALGESAFDMVLMDVEMPEMDGLAATRTIRAGGSAYSAIPIVALTANAMDEQIERCRMAGMNDHVAKPIDREQLLTAVARWSTAT